MKRLFLAAAVLGLAAACSSRNVASTACISQAVSPPSVSPTESVRSLVGPTEALQKASALISAANGGSVHIPSGSIQFPAHTFKSNTRVTLELLSAPDAQPPNSAVDAKGQMMAVLIGSGGTRPRGSERSSKRSTPQLDTAPVVVTQSLPSSESSYSSRLAPEVEYNDPKYGPVWMDFGGNVKGKTATLRVPATILAEAAGSRLQFIPVDDLAPPRPYFGGLALSKGSWQHFDASSAPKCAQSPHHAIVFVHGILSSVDGGAFPATTAQAIQSAGGYDAVYGFNYQWWLPPNAVRPLLASFLNDLYKKGYFDAYDLEAHSYGGVVSLFALSNLLSRQHTVSPLNFITLASPFGGTSAANLDYFKSVLANNQGIFGTHAELMESATDGMTASLSPISAQPGGMLYRAAAEVYPKYAPARTIKVAGSAPFAIDAAFGILKYLQLIKLFFAGEYDGIVTTDSALSPNVPTSHQATFTLWHWELASSPGVIHYVASQLEPVPRWNVSAADSGLGSAPAPPCSSTQNVFCIGLNRGERESVRVSDATGQYNGPMVAVVQSPCPYVKATVERSTGPIRPVTISANSAPATPTTCKVIFKNWDTGNPLPPFSHSPEIDIRVGPTP
jgi:hypothetical protein